MHPHLTGMSGRRTEQDRCRGRQFSSFIFFSRSTSWRSRSAIISSTCACLSSSRFTLSNEEVSFTLTPKAAAKRSADLLFSSFCSRRCVSTAASISARYISSHSFSTRSSSTPAAKALLTVEEDLQPDGADRLVDRQPPLEVVVLLLCALLQQRVHGRREQRVVRFGRAELGELRDVDVRLTPLHEAA
ncbi:hypothetical protein STCU_00651 [Strigomonas culicis]|uniref:Uncharacterized protein n=1 Tax=Strigomonas culicis TaxID=28005 RepID=S9UZL7_9TRYP|nr:hypothetical protein STCU_00651 [Strigomonas culicis]|eukprot:EPY36307.1 hypothetical protein STCU_00651 [Strigomonas culicis]